MRVNDLTGAIIGAAIEVHRVLGYSKMGGIRRLVLNLDENTEIELQ
jgi:hypothetical protein